jgi:hypothetical protein
LKYPVLTLHQKAAVLDTRITQVEKEKGAGAHAKQEPDGINGRINQVERPVFPMKKPGEKIR